MFHVHLVKIETVFHNEHHWEEPRTSVGPCCPHYGKKRCVGFLKVLVTHLDFKKSEGQRKDQLVDPSDGPLIRHIHIF